MPRPLHFDHLVGLRYRTTARLLHRFDLHHTRRIGPMEDGAIIHRCNWCGLSRTEWTRAATERKMRAEGEARRV